MADRSKIEWTDASWNPIRARLTRKVGTKAQNALGWHCEHATTGCINCYAEGMNIRLGTGLPFKPGHLDNGDVELFLDDNMLRLPLRWTRPRKIFVGSMTDLFGRFVKDEWLDKIFAVMALCPQHTFQVVTKRSERMRKYLTARNGMGNAAICRAINDLPANVGDRRGALEMPLPNVWLGVSVERQQEANARIPDLQKTPAAVRFVSAEPLLGPVELDDIVRAFEGGEDHHSALECDVDVEDDQEFGGAVIDWVIVGGESGRNARPMHPDWARSLRDQCQAAGVAFFFKQWGMYKPFALSQQLPSTKRKVMLNGRGFSYQQIEGYALVNVGKEGAGRLLDGVEHNAMPERAR
ncbi:phage Gp37/Gp68 family protein [Bradyrhizobium sp. SZCCHNS3002]|uniref:DUF5131 family protein n=1 Tax=Bradyrhizobium sp. SZCCHNS3002 TaxID=3057310 RepID=UPI0028EAE436|nr:phage Gp37/Gp68 family protein [Bradyrhizobium sp. SZCCHNS3002]